MLRTHQRRVMSAPFRLPLPPGQDIGARLSTNLLTTLMDPTSSLPRIKGTRPHHAMGPLPAFQRFTMHGPGGPNAPATLAAGAHKMNARRLTGKTRGTGAGI